ncbi:MAG: choice-of-anchor Q domain-containing protein [Verrucomicrobiota bacterium]
MKIYRLLAATATGQFKSQFPRILAALCGVTLLFAPLLAKALITSPYAVRVDALTLSATNVTSSSATLVGEYTIIQLGIGADMPVTVIPYFEYGLTTNYGSTTPATTYANRGVYSIPITSLAPGTTYHFRAVVDHYVYVGTRDSGTAYGGDLTFTTPAAPTSLVVSNSNDLGTGPLRSAIAGVQAGGLITFAANLSGQTITLTSGQLVLNTNVTIDASALANGISINGNASSRIFQVNGGANVALKALTLTNGYQGGNGLGGAITNGGILTLINCTLAGNSVAGSGAGGAIHNKGQLTLNGCTLFANTAAFAGAINNNNAICTLKNCTFSGNSATNGNGGAIDNAFSATLNLLHCTFNGNSATGNGGGIDNYQSQINLTNTIIAGSASHDIYNWSGSAINFGGSNIVQVLGNGGTVLGGSTIRAVNPLLGALANNGGPTRTLLPQGGSPAIDAGVNSFAASLATDQRGQLRLSGGFVDIGAVEVRSPILTTLPASGVTTNAATLNGTVNPLGITTMAYFQYGLTTSYGSTTAGQNPGTGNSAVAYSAPITGLSPGTTYQFRAVASTADGLTYGTNLSFTTPSSFALTNVVANTNDAGGGSLRAAILSTAPGGFITFAANLAGQSIRLTSGQLVLNASVTIDASMLTNGISINGNASNRIFQVNAAANVVLNALTLTNGFQGNDGDLGGAIVNYGTLALTNCTLAGNSVAKWGAGGAIHNAGQLALSGCALYANSGSFAGALNNNAVCTLKNCTFFGNSSTNGNGGAIDNNYYATLNVLHCTLSGNTTVGGGGAIDNYLSQLNITNTIIAGNTGYGNGIYNWSDSAITFGGSNIVQGLVSDGTVTGSSAIRAVNPLLGPLANHGGRTMSQLLQSGSPAIDAGANSAASGLATDQRGQPRLAGSAVDIGAAEMQAAESPYYPVTIIVTTTADAGPASLRAAAASVPFGGVITFATNLSGQTITLTSGQIVLSNSVTIDASMLTNGISINGNASSRIFEVNNGASVVLNSLTITNGYNNGSGQSYSQSYGGGILGLLGHLTLNNCKLVNNRCVNGTGGALASMYGSLTMNATTVSGNICNNTSAIYVQDQPANIVGCTISGNSGTVGDALRFSAAFNDAALSVLNTTISGNLVTGNSGFGAAAITLQAGSGFTASAYLTNCTVVNNTVVQAGMAGAIFFDPQSGTNTLTLYNSIVSGNTSGGVAADIGSNATPNSSFNLIGVGGGLVNGVNGNKVGINNPQVAALGNYGGVTQTMPPLVGSLAIDAGGTVPFATDQRGFQRLFGSAVDIGAVESQDAGLSNNIVMTTANSGPNSLRAAIASVPSGGTVIFAPNLSGQTITLTSGQIVLSNSVTIDASTLANGISINGNASSRIFQVLNGANVVLNALTLTNGYQGTNGFAGAIANYGTLALNNCTLAGNSVAPFGTGGAIHNVGQLTLSGCTLFANTGKFAGAINNNAVCTLKNCTFSGNSATVGNGGAIDNAFSATLNILHCTFSGNSSDGYGGAIDNYQSQINLTNTIIAGNPVYEDIYNWSGSTITAGGSNIVQVLGNEGTVLGGNSIRAVNPLLGPLANNGGPTLTLLPLAGSPAIDAGVSSAAAGLVIDQRGLARVSGSAADIGAVEVQIVVAPHVFTGAAPGQGLDLQGNFLYAVNVGNNGAPGLIGDANFTADTVSGVTITTPGGALNTLNNWANPNFGATTDGLRLMQVMSSIRWTGVPGIFTVNLSGLQVGTNYQLQLLFIESLSDRVFNVTVNGTTIVPNFRFLDYGPSGTPIVISYAFTAASNNALIQLGGGVGGNDNNPHISGFTLETLLPATTPTPTVISSVTQSGTNLIFAVTNGVPGTGWTCLTTTNLAPPVIWSTNRTGTFDGQGSATLTNGILSTEPARYYILRTP